MIERALSLKRVRQIEETEYSSLRSQLSRATTLTLYVCCVRQRAEHGRSGGGAQSR
jgi:hypothetical protein